MKEFTSYDMAVLVYENYIDLDSLKDALEISDRGIKRKIEGVIKMDKIYSETFTDHVRKNTNLEEELNKFDEIKKQIEEIEF